MLVEFTEYAYSLVSAFFKGEQKRILFTNLFIKKRKKLLTKALPCAIIYLLTIMNRKERAL